jgi:hypothetical protein
MTSTLSMPGVRSERIRALTLDDAVRLLPLAGGAAAAGSIALVAYKVWRTPHFAYFSIVASWAVATVVASLIMSIVLRRLAASWPDWMSRDGAASWVLAIEVGVVLLVVPVFLLVKSIPEEDMTGWMWPLLNKRWLIALYNLSIATFLLFPVAIQRSRMQAKADLAPPAIFPQRPRKWHRWILAIAGQAAVTALCWYLAGPPWHLERYHRSIEWHEQMHFGSLQAIAKGYLPAVGPAATPYGAGSQMLIVGVMKRLGGFNLASFRTAWVTQHFLAVLVVGTVAYWWLGFLPAVAVIFLATLYSPLAFFYTLVDGTLAGFFGWANPLRYCAPLVVVPALAAAAIGDSRAWTVVLLGGVLGLGTWLAQENLTTTATSALLLMTLLWLTRTIPLSRGAWLLRNLAVGFGCVVIPVLVYYALHGAAVTFLQSYFFFARAIAVGFSNMWWPSNESAAPERYSYYFTLPFLVGAAICALWRLPALRLVAPLDRRRTMFLAFICVQLVCYQTALLRSDSTHLMNTMIALPFILVMGFVDLPGWLASAQMPRWWVRAAFVVLVLATYPALKKADWRALTHPARRFQASPALPVPNPETSSRALVRLRPLLPNEPLFLGDSMSVGEFLNFSDGLHTIIGQRKTYLVRIDWIAGGLIAFLADLTPAPHPPGGDLLTINDNVRTRIANHIRTHPQDYEAFIGPSISDPEAQAFLESHPGAVAEKRRVGGSDVYILLSKM